MEKRIRKLKQQLQAHLSYKEFTIITGARQTGKSTLMQQIHNDLIKSGEKSYSITFEDSSILNAVNEHPERIFDFIPYPSDKRIYLLIDEVQYAANPSNFLKLLYDKYAPQLKIIATGSSAFYIDRKFNDSLAGRKKLFELFTLSFEEFIEFKTLDNTIVEEYERIKDEPKYIGSKRVEIENLFQEYLTYGGYPAVVLAKPEDKKGMLKELINTYVKKDILESNIQDEQKFFNLFTILAHQAGSLVNVNELANTLRLSTTAIDNYLYVMQKSFHISLVKPFYSNIRKEITKMPKVYFNDLGLRNILTQQFMPIAQRMDKGEVVENYSFLRLRQQYGADAVNYWRTADGNEVDFVVSTGYQKGFAIEAKFDKREYKPSKYKKFTEHYPEYPITCWSFEADENDGKILRK